jgi:hypothetical protein
MAERQRLFIVVHVGKLRRAEKQSRELSDCTYRHPLRFESADISGDGQKLRRGPMLWPPGCHPQFNILLNIAIVLP